VEGVWYRAIVWLHITAACAWVGGLLFFSLVLVPVLRRSPGPHARELVLAVGRRFRVVGWTSLAILLLTGAANVLFRVPFEQLFDAALWSSAWGRLLACKLSLVLLTVVVSVLHDRSGSRAARAEAPAQRKPGGAASLLGRALGLLALALLLVAVLLVRGY
jgi:putative copper export protein